MASLSHVFLPGLLCLFLISSSEGACRFPQEFYRDERWWRFTSPDYDLVTETPHLWRRVTPEGERLHVDYMLEKGKPVQDKTLTYHCMDIEDEDRYVLMWQSAGRVQFVCVQFVVRGLDVIQWRMSDSGPRRPGMCDDNKLKLHPAPMVYYNEIGGVDRSGDRPEPPPCPLYGGYVITQWYDEQGNYGCETDAVPPLKLENACEHGEGLYFLGGGDQCGVPHEMIKVGKPYRCMASWEDSSFTFMVVGQEGERTGAVPCLRYPTVHRDRFTMHLFLDGVCDGAETVRTSRQFRQMAMALFPALGICSDDTPACRLKDTTQCEFALAKSCRQSCQTCPPNAGWTDLTFPEEFRGIWLKDSNYLGKENVTISEQYISIPSLGNYRTMGESGCSLQHPSQAPYGLTSASKEYSLIQTFMNGCSHRMTMLLIVSRSESVLSFRVTRSGLVDWDLEVNEPTMKWQIMGGWEKWCTRVTNVLPQLRPRDSPRTDLTGWFNLVRVDDDAPTVNCSVPDNLLDQFHMVLPTGQECAGVLSRPEPDALQLDYKDCKSSGNLESGSHAINHRATFECLAAFDGESGRTFLVTRTPSDQPNAVNETHICWVFSTHRLFGSVYWFRVSDCDANSDVYAQRGFRQELATFDFQFEALPTEKVVVSGAKGTTHCVVLSIISLVCVCAAYVLRT